MDSQCYNGLSEDTPHKNLDKWPGVKHLISKRNEYFQVIARDVATSRGVMRCDLDVLYWRKAVIEGMIDKKRRVIPSAVAKRRH